jgi:hypothetical protein
MITTKTISRDALMAKLRKAYPSMFLRTTEEFSGSVGGIWTSGEDSPEDRTGLPLFNYYGREGTYDIGVRPHFNNFVQRNGWWCEWHDAGTIMIWPL